MELIQISKREKSSAEKKIIYSNCLAKDIKLSSLMGATQAEVNLDSLIIDDYFYKFEVLVLNC